MVQHIDDGPEGFEFDRRSMLRKLAVGGSIVWASPMIASRASALLPPSQCVNGVTVNWTDLYPEPPNTTNLSNPVTITDIEGSGVDVTIGATVVGTTVMARNFQVQSAPGAEHGGITGNSLMFEQRPYPNTHSADPPTIGLPNDQGGGQTVTISFSITVRNVVFTITDIDNQNSTGFDQIDWSDRITLITTPSVPPVGGAAIIGVGAAGNGTNLVGTDPDPNTTGNGGTNTATGAYRNSNPGTNILDDNGAGNLTLTYAGPIDTVQFRYWCGGIGTGSGEGIGSSSSNQRINLSNITFDTCPEGVTPNFAPSPVQSELRVPASSDEPPAPVGPNID